MINGLIAAVVFVRDLATCTAFYRDTFQLRFQFSDAESSTFILEEGKILTLLSPEGTADLLGMQVHELKLDGAPRGLLAATVANVDVAYEKLTARGVMFVRPPTDQVWGIRTAHFVDPEGNLWEINQPIPGKTEE